jgi:hypothetical protein
MRLIQLYADGFEALYNFDDTISDQMIKTSYEEFEQSEYDDYEEFMNETYPDIFCDRVFADEVYI